MWTGTPTTNSTIFSSAASRRNRAASRSRELRL
jgi:hypothetical protein